MLPNRVPFQGRNYTNLIQNQTFFLLYLLDLLLTFPSAVDFQFPSVSDRWFSPKATPKTLPHNNFPAAADIHALARGPGGKVIHCFAIPQPSKDSILKKITYFIFAISFLIINFADELLTSSFLTD